MVFERLPDSTQCPSGKSSTSIKKSTEHVHYIESSYHTENTASNRKTNRLMLSTEINAVYFKNHSEHINTPCGRNARSLLLNLAMHIVTSRFTGLIFYNVICCNIIYCNVILIVTEASERKWSLVPRHYRHIKNVINCNDVNF
jgi:hypothetical protein